MQPDTLIGGGASAEAAAPATVGPVTAGALVDGASVQRAHPRTVGWIGATALAMGGSNQSLFLVGALIASQGSAAVPLLIIGLLLSWASAFGWTELVLMWPDRVGGIAASCAEAFRPYNPVLSTLTGVCYWWGWVPTCGLTAILSASAITQWYLPDVPVPPLAVGLVAFFTLVNLAGVRWVTRLAIPIASVAAGLALVSGLAPVLAGNVDWQLASNFHLVSPFPGLFGDVTSAMAGLYLIGFAAPAFEAAACHVGETIDPERNVPRAMLASGAMAAVYFVLLPVIWLGVLGPESLQGDLAQVLGPTFAPVFGASARAAAIGFMMLNMFNGTLQPLAGASRTLMQLAEDGLLPRVFALRSRTDVPWVATLMTALPAIAFLLAGDPTWLIAAANLAYLIGIGLPSVAVWLLRRDAPHLLRPYRAPRGTIELGLLAALVWGVSCLLGFQQFGLPTVIVGLMLCYSGAGLFAFRRLSDRRRAGLPAVKASLHLKLTGAMLLVMALDGAGYLLAVDHVDHEQAALVAALEDIFVAVALLTVSVGLVLPGTIAHAAEEVARAADRLATGTLADLVRAIQALGVGDLDDVHVRVDLVPVVVHTRDELGAMAASFNTMQANVASAAIALGGAREGLRHARTELEASHATLRTSEERSRLALQSASMGTWDVDYVTNVHTWSVETEALFGLAPGTFGGTEAAYRSLVHPDDWQACAAEIAASEDEQRDSFVTYRVIWPDGAEHWIEESGRRLHGPDGTLLRMTGTSMDITERKQAEVALRTSEERFRKQYKGIPLPTYSWQQLDGDFVLLDYNDAATVLSDGRVQEWLGRRASDCYVDQPEILAELHACALGQRTLRHETRYRSDATGPDRHLAITYVFVPPRTVMLHTEDITEAKQAERQREAMAQSEKLRALGQMASGIAHDLNQTLMLVASYSDLARQALVEDPPNIAELEDLLTTATQAALDGGETVKRLLLFTRATPGQDGKRVDLSSVVREAAQLTAPRWRDAAQAEGRPISLRIDAAGEAAIQGSAARLRELMTNLIFNAVDALPTGGTIRLRVVAEGQRGIIEVSDSGLGMTAEVQARVFEPFFTTKGEGGTGLGLAMVFGIVEQHGGHIEVQSAPGDGTTFRLTFPLLEGVVEAPVPARAVRPSAFARPLRVLAVDDEPMMTRALVRMLRPSGHVISIAASGEEALERLAEQTFDVVVSDMGMGAGMNGWELADAVRHRWPSVRFMLATGWGAAIDPGEAQTKGVEAILSKPYHPSDLLRALAGEEAAA